MSRPSTRTRTRTRTILFLPERHAHRLEESAGFLVGAGGGADDDVHAADLVDFIVLDLREDELLANAHCEVAAAVERVGVDTLEVTDEGQGGAHQAVQEFIHHLAAQRDLAAYPVALADLEVGDRLAGARYRRPLTGDDAHVANGIVAQLGISAGLPRLSHAHVDDDLLHARNLHHVLIIELLLQVRGYLGSV